MPTNRHSHPFPGTDINPDDAFAEAFILMVLNEFTPEDERYLHDVNACMLELPDKYLNNFFDRFAGENSIPQMLIDSIPPMFEQARQKRPDLTAAEFASEHARGLFQDLVFYD